ncbi:MAG: hypothetical protein LOD94_00685 [Gammaproteobacteria bacterium]
MSEYRSMIPRYLVAFVGASLITSAMLLGMNEVARRLKERDPTQYFQISSFIPAPEDRRPRRPPAPQARPELPQIEYATPLDADVPLSVPTVDPDRLASPPLVPEPSPGATPH